MLSWINKQGVRSSEGFDVQSLDRFTIQYREGKRFVNIPIERGVMGSKSSVSISAAAFERWNNSSVINDAAEQSRMRRNFVAAMEFQGIVVE